MPGPAIPVEGGVRVLIRATPKSSQDKIIGLVSRGRDTRLRVKVRAAPQDGEANAAIIRLIAKSLGCKPSCVSIAAGAKDRDKTVLLQGVRIEDAGAWLGGLRRNGETD